MRVVAVLTGATALCATVLAVYGNLLQTPELSWLASITEILRYFTIFTNLVVGVFLLHAALFARWASFSGLTALTLWISIVGVVYHVLLSATYQPAGLLAWASLAHHTVVPIGVTFLWLVTRSRELIPIKAPIYWMLFPLVYGCYAIARGYFGDGLYPYVYIDPNVIGWRGVFLSQLGFFAFFLGMGYFYRWVANRITLRKSRSTSL